MSAQVWILQDKSFARERNKYGENPPNPEYCFEFFYSHATQKKRWEEVESKLRTFEIDFDVTKILKDDLILGKSYLFDILPNGKIKILLL